MSMVDEEWLFLAFVVKKVEFQSSKDECCEWGGPFKILRKPWFLCMRIWWFGVPPSTLLCFLNWMTVWWFTFVVGYVGVSLLQLFRLVFAISHQHRVRVSHCYRSEWVAMMFWSFCWFHKGQWWHWCWRSALNKGALLSKLIMKRLMERHDQILS